MTISTIMHFYCLFFAILDTYIAAVFNLGMISFRNAVTISNPIELS